MNRNKWWLRPIIGLVALIAIFFGPTTYGQYTAERRISARLRSVMETTQIITRVEVYTGFQPEDFHIKYLQQFGMIGGVTDHSLFLLTVNRDNVPKIAAIYWIKMIDIPQE